MKHLSANAKENILKFKSLLINDKRDKRLKAIIAFPLQSSVVCTKEIIVTRNA